MLFLPYFQLNKIYPLHRAVNGPWAQLQEEFPPLPKDHTLQAHTEPFCGHAYYNADFDKLPVTQMPGFFKSGSFLTSGFYTISLSIVPFQGQKQFLHFYECSTCRTFWCSYSSWFLLEIHLSQQRGGDQMMLSYTHREQPSWSVSFLCKVG